MASLKCPCISTIDIFSSIRYSLTWRNLLTLSYCRFCFLALAGLLFCPFSLYRVKTICLSSAFTTSPLEQNVDIKSSSFLSIFIGFFRLRLNVYILYQASAQFKGMPAVDGKNFGPGSSPFFPGPSGVHNILNSPRIDRCRSCKGSAELPRSASEASRWRRYACQSRAPWPVLPWRQGYRGKPVRIFPEKSVPGGSV